jgi:hypothetical protein
VLWEDYVEDIGRKTSNIFTFNKHTDDCDADLLEDLCLLNSLEDTGVPLALREEKEGWGQVFGEIRVLCWRPRRKKQPREHHK